MELSVILPIYNRGAQIRADVTRLVSFLESHFSSFEVILVNDGSSDDTAAQLGLLHHSAIRVEHLSENRGKFAAIKRGMELSRGACRIFTDADLPYDDEAICYIYELVLGRGYHVVVGDRTLFESNYNRGVPLRRRIASRAYSHIIRLLLTGGLNDTQCGIKGFSAAAAQALFPLVRDNRFAGDIELIYIALKYNLEIRRIPVRLRHWNASTIAFSRDVLPMLYRVVALPILWRTGEYKSQALKELGSQYYWKTISDGAEGPTEAGRESSHVPNGVQVK